MQVRSAVQSFLTKATLIVGAAALIAAAPAALYMKGPPIAHTGGFGEPTCHQCHFDSELTSANDALRIDGVPAVYEEGRTYRLRVSLADSAMKRAGFQLSARFEDGKQAGMLSPCDTLLLQVLVSPATQVAYLEHRAAGTTARNSASWDFDWTAPTHKGTVVFHVAANAANDDASEFGDHIYSASFFSR
jgi:hypothetical protein